MAHRPTRAGNSSVSSLSSSASSSASSGHAAAQPGSQVIAQPPAPTVAQPALPGLPIAQFQPNIPLMTTNALVGLSQVPGNLDYHGYIQYITRLGHVRNPANTQGLAIPAQPHNSSQLQSTRGDRNDNLTDYRPDQALWSQDNFPGIIYVFDKPANWLGKGDLEAPPLKTYPIYGKLLRDIPILPDHISSDLEGWRYEAWCRFDPRIKKHDVVDRMPPASRGQHNADLSMRTQRFRRDANILGWVAKGGKFAGEKQRLQQLLQAAGVPLALNTTRGISWGTNPYGQPIPVPAKLRWDSCVEAAPAQAPVAPLGPVVATTLPLPPFAATGSAPINAPVSAAVGQVSAPPPIFTAATNTLPPIQATNIPVTQAPSAHGTQIPALPVVPRTSSLPRPPSPTTSALSRNLAANLVPGNPISYQLLDPQLIQPCPPGQPPATGTMNPPPQVSQARPSVNFSSSIAMSTATAGPQQHFRDAVSNTQQPSLSSAGLQPAASSVEGAAGPSSRNPTTDTANHRKRSRDDDNQEPDRTYTGQSTVRPVKKPRRSNLMATAANNEPRRGFRMRWPRAAFGGAGEDSPQSLSEWVQQGGASQGENTAGLVDTEQIQPARASLGYHERRYYLHEGNGDVVAAPEDFVHSDGVDTGRLMRLGYYEHVPNDVNAGRKEWVGEAEGLPLDYYQMDHAARPEATTAPAPVEFTPQDMGWYLAELNEGESNILSQDLASSKYPPLE